MKCESWMKKYNVWQYNDNIMAVKKENGNNLLILANMIIIIL